ncbi:MAG: hypothetical protein GY932_13385, partial [Arcobacter sp.]|nr:hypothetical protein [Arcobacter sp.]
DAWAPTTELSATQEAQLQWYFIKNNDQGDKNIITDNPTDDNITINGLEMSVKLNEENRFKYGHAFCYVVDPEKEGQTITELKRKVIVTNIKGTDVAQKNDTIVKNVTFTTTNLRQEELDEFRTTIIEIDKENKETNIDYKLTPSLRIEHQITKNNLKDIFFKVEHISDLTNKDEDVTYIRPLFSGERANIRIDGE